MHKETMSPRERWLAVLQRKKPDRVPMDYWATAEANEKLCQHLGCDLDEALRRLHVDCRFGVGPRYVGPQLPEGIDEFGVRYQSVNYGSGSYGEPVSNPLAAYESVAEIEANYRWPTADWWDHGDLRKQVKGKEHLPITAGGSEPFLRYCYLRGQEQAYMDLVINPELVHYCLDKLFNLAYETTRRIYEAIPGKVLLSYVAEDLGSQQSLLFSKAHIHEFLLPRMKRMMQLIHDNGVFVFHHSDGAIREIIPDMIAAGIDILNPLQWRLTGMDREGLKRDFGKKVIFHGAVDNQTTLPFGSVAEVREEVADNLRILGAGGGYIIAPCHNIQVVSPPQNVVAMYEAGYEMGWGK